MNLACPAGTVIKGIAFASYGTPTGACGNYALGTCHASDSLIILEARCLGTSSCSIQALNQVFGDACYGTVKRLYVQASCGTP